MSLDPKTQASIDRVFGKATIQQPTQVKPAEALTDTTQYLLLLDVQSPGLKSTIDDLKYLLGPEGLNPEKKGKLLKDLESRADEARNSKILRKDYTFNPGFLGMKRNYNERCLIRTLGELKDDYMRMMVEQIRTRDK